MRTAVSPVLGAMFLIGFLSDGTALAAPAGPVPVRLGADGSVPRDVPLPPLSVPAGFEVVAAALPPVTKFPMMGCLDERGRLFLSEAAGVNMTDKQLEKALPNMALMLEDTHGQGVYDKRTVFADKLTEPNGACWYDGALYICSAPYLWRFEDTNGHGVADKRERVLGRFNYPGNASAFHGPRLGPDGRLYFCGGQHGWTLGKPGSEPPIRSSVPGVFSCWPDGSDPEQLSAGGVCNPVEVTFSAEGEVFGTVAVYEMLKDGRRTDAMLHWIYGGVHNIGPGRASMVRTTGEPLKPLSRRGHVAPNGVVRYRGTQFGPEYRDNIFLCEFNTHKMYRLILERDGATFRCREEVFLSSTDTDTHFTNVIEDADGSLLVFNTGGWFANGCPTSKLAKPNILGGIYRIRRIGAPKIDDPRGAKIAWDQQSADELISLLDDPRPAVQDRALDVLARRGSVPPSPPIPGRKLINGSFRNIGSDTVAALRSALSGGSIQRRRNAVWALTRIGTDEAREAVRTALSDKDFSVRLTATRSVSTRRDAAAKSRLLKLLAGDEPAVRREAATALGRIGDKAAVPALLAGLKGENDRFLEHALIYALIEIHHRQATLAGLSDDSPVVRRGALIALDQMSGGNLSRELVAPLLDSPDKLLQRTALSVISRHKGWAVDSIALMRNWLSDPTVPEDRQAPLRGTLTAFAADKNVQSLVAETLGRPATSRDIRLLLLDVMARSELDRLPRSWQSQLAALLKDRNPQLLAQTIAVIALGDERTLDGELLGIARDNSQPIAVRVAAAGVIAHHGHSLPKPVFELLVARCRPDVGPVDRLDAARALADVPVGPDSLGALSALIAGAGPLELPTLVRSFERSTSSQAGLALVAALQKSPGARSLTAARLANLLSTYPADVRSAALPLLKRTESDRKAQAARLAELRSVLSGGDPAHGRELFFGSKASCSSCHSVGNQGGNIGPNLSQVGRIRTRADLLESVVYPSATIVQGFEPYDVETSSGKVLTGLLGRQTAELIYLRTADRAEIRIRRSEIAGMTPSRVSIMPEGFDKALSPDQLRDLLAFLQSQK